MEKMDSTLSLYVSEKHNFTATGSRQKYFRLLGLKPKNVLLYEKPYQVKTRKGVQYHEQSPFSIKK